MKQNIVTGILIAMLSVIYYNSYSENKVIITPTTTLFEIKKFKQDKATVCEQSIQKLFEQKHKSSIENKKFPFLVVGIIAAVAAVVTAALPVWGKYKEPYSRNKPSFASFFAKSS